MIRSYLLSVKRIDGADIVQGMEHIHNAILYCTAKPDIRLLVMDTTEDEDGILSTLALEVRNPTKVEVAQLSTLPEDVPTELDELRARIASLESREVPDG